MILNLKTIKDTYQPHLNEVEAEAMSRYMRYQFPFLGIRKKDLAPINKLLFKTYTLPEGEGLKCLAQALFLEEEREYHYMAIRILERQKDTLYACDLYFLESLLLQHSWWDSIDDISPNIAGHIIKNRGEDELHRMWSWVKSDNFWLQRAGLLHQLKFKEQMNESLLIAMIDELKHEKEFFIRKAIGWILREYSKTNPDFVIRFVSNHQLSPLSEREAMKWMKTKRRESDDR
ncbi:DNA alkylation repair protein [Macrococcus hajekii]|uniref:DNA alkylation repair protein n=1 Tax=Macrococcus hajekii TaxID=198482 RepID=A0A4R6BJ60_9STAP|nr:DNA alkylation repair protein [Macrococcus hajekii]TDM01677.1 DNA alkylation repair protein [Macrococcus hajekii]GGB13298.1 hypothetical protein GCM10007190_21760 [Macrococcus hajekii]